MQHFATAAEHRHTTIALCLFMLPEFFLLFAPATARRFFVHVGPIRFSSPQAEAFFRSDRFLLTLRLAAAAFLAILSFAVYLSA